MNVLESVQKRATKTMMSLEQLGFGGKKQSQHFLSGAQDPTDNEFKLKHKEIHLNLSCSGFSLIYCYLQLTSINTGAGCLDRFPPSTETFKTQLDMALSTLC